MRAVVALLMFASAVPAHFGSGDDVKPRDTESIVESVEGTVPPGFLVDVVGGDAFLRVAAGGHTVDVPGYDGEPYLRIAVDGTVEENVASRTWRMNTDRYGRTDPGPSGAAENWTVTARNGIAMWHDHRIHWMGTTPPVVTDGDGTVQEWSVPMKVDGNTITVRGTLYLRDAATPLWWLLAVPAMLVAVVVARGPRRRWYAFLRWVTVAGTFVGFLQWWAMPSVARITPVLALFCLAGLVASNVSHWFARPRTPEPDGSTPAVNDWVASSIAAGAGAALVTAAVLVRAQVTAGWVPMFGPMWWARAIVPLLVGAGVVAVVDGVVRAVRVEPAAD